MQLEADVHLQMWTEALLTIIYDLGSWIISIPSDSYNSRSYVLYANVCADSEQFLKIIKIKCRYNE